MAEVDSLEIKISATSEDAAKKVNDLAAALEKVKKALSGGGLDKVSEKIQAIGNVSQQIKLSVDPESGKAVDGLTAKVVALRNAVEQVNQTAIKIKVPSTSGSGAGTGGSGGGKTSPGTRHGDDTGDVEPSGNVNDTEKRISVIARLLDKIKNNPFGSIIRKQFDDATSSAKSFEKAFSSTDTIFDNLKNAASDAFSQIMAAHPKLAAVALAIKAVYNTVQKFFDEVR